MDKRAVNAILAIIGMKKSEFAELSGYDDTYVRQVLTGQNKASRPFRRAFFSAVDEAVFGRTVKVEDPLFRKDEE